MSTEVEPKPISPGHVVAGRYRIEYRVGQGGGGEVYRAQDDKLERPLALKRMLGGEGEERIRQAMDEARILARLRHPCIPTVFDLIVDAGELWLITTFVDGKSLYRILREGHRYSLTEAIRINRELAEILKFAHGKRVAHSDIKPSNILVGDDGRITLTDFGVARVLSNERWRPGPAVLKGTEGYLAPEVYDADASKLDLRTCARWDLYALGVVFFNMLVLDMPSAVKREEIPTQVEDGLRIALEAEADFSGEGTAQVPPELLDAVIDLLARTLEPDPEKRIRSSDEYMQELDKIEALLERKRAGKGGSLSGGAWAGIAVAALAAGVGAGVALQRFVLGG